ncbi:MAG TPA: ankyrin repeat domain-containing protein [Candidatus Polarisedimenticolaceae bacterium]|nr:ankyrin repeat domain-containing protein [Candidatus Polarisedimenticolaceae bacterium]
MRLNLEQLRKQAKEMRAAGAHATLAEAQLALARQHGYASWARLKRALELQELRRLIEEGDAAAAATLLASSPWLVRATFDDGSTPLHLAAGENRPELVDLLVRHGASPHAAFGKSAHSALSWALTCWAYAAAEKLVARGVEPDLFCAAGLGRLDLVRAFWPGGTLRPHPSRTGSSRYTEEGKPLPRPPRRDADQVSDALYLACRCDRLEVARWLLDHGADPNWRGYAGATCLAWAEFSENAELSALLRARGGDDGQLDHTYHSSPKVFPLMVFAGWGFPRRLLARVQEDPSLVQARGGRGTLLHAAVEGAQEGSVRILLHFGADRRALDAEGRTAGEVARTKGHPAIAELLES